MQDIASLVLFVPWTIILASYRVQRQIIPKPIGQYYSLGRTNASRPGGYAGGRPDEDEYGKRNVRPEGEGTRDSPSSRAAGHKGEGCR